MNVDESAVEAIHVIADTFTRLIDLYSINHSLAQGFGSKSLGISEGLENKSNATELINNMTSKVAAARSLLQSRYGDDLPAIGPLESCVAMSSPKRELF